MIHKLSRFLTTLVALFTISTGAWADETVFEYANPMVGTLTQGTTGTSATTVNIHTNSTTVNAIKFSNSYVYADGKYITIAPSTGSFKKGDVVSIAGCINIATAGVYAKAGIYTADGATQLYETANVINGRDTNDDPTVETYTLTQDADKLLIARSTGSTALYITTLKVVRTASDPAAGKVYTSAVNITALQVGDILAEGASINGSGMIYFDLNRAKWDGNLHTEGTMYLYTDDFDSFGAEGVISLSNNTTMSPVDKDNNDGNAWEVTNVHIEENNNYINIQGITYAPAGIEVNGPTIVEGKPQWTFEMPAGNVELLVAYYPGMLVKPTNLVGGTMEIEGLTDTTLPEGFEKDDDGNIYVAKDTKFTVKAVPAEGYHLVAWSDDATNKELEREFTMGDDDFTLTATFSDEYDLAFNALNANTIEDGKATVKVGDTDKTADIQDGKLTGVKYGQTVTLTAATGYKFRSVEAKKGAAAAKTITIGDVELTYADGDTWETIVSKNSDKIKTRAGGYIVQVAQPAPNQYRYLNVVLSTKVNPSDPIDPSKNYQWGTLEVNY